MNRPVITSLTIDRPTLFRWVQTALADELLRSPAEVIDIQVDDEIVHIDLHPQQHEPVATILAAQPPVLAKPATNGNGHKPGRGNPIITPEHKEFIRKHIDWTAMRIAAELGVPDSSVATYLTQYRKEAKQLQDAAAQPFPAEA